MEFIAYSATERNKKSPRSYYDVSTKFESRICDEDGHLWAIVFGPTVEEAEARAKILISNGRLQ